jgi:GNAT superfamily N-acetyltransferase
MKKIDIEIQDDKIIQGGVNAIIDFYNTLAVDKKFFSDTFAFATLVDSPFLNVLFDTRIERTNSSAVVASANDFFNPHQIPWGWFIVPASYDNDLEKQGFTLLEEAPAMYFDLSNQLPDVKSDFISIQEVAAYDDLTIWIQPINEGFEAKEDDDAYRKLNADILQKGEKKLRHFVAYYKEQLAASGTLFLSDEAVMLHNVATKTAFKRYGIATALTLHMMQTAKKLGFQHCYLDASEDAFNLYKKIGFKVYCTTLIYSPANHSK